MAVVSEAALLALPPLVFTVAITGHQDIDRAQHDDLQAQVERLLAQARERLLARMAGSKIDAPRGLSLRFLTALAPGADQIGARAVLAVRARDKAAGAAPLWDLHAVLPFAPPVYAALAAETLRERGVGEPAMAEALAGIDTLAGEAQRVLQLADWQPDADEALSRSWQSRRYATIGQMLVRRADLLIALWDGNPARGPGGTADVVSEARRSGVPVVWIDHTAPAPDEPPRIPRSLLPDHRSRHMQASDLIARWRMAEKDPEADNPFAQQVQPAAEAALEAATAQVLLGGERGRAICVRRYAAEPPSEVWLHAGETGAPQPGDRFLGYARMLYWFLNWPPRKTRVQSEADAAAGKPPAPLRSYPFAKARRDGAGAVQTVLRYPFGFGVEPGTAGTAHAAPLLEHAARADALATRLSNQYRSAYVWIFALAPLAVMWAVVSVLVKDFKPLDLKPLFVVFELATVSAAAAIYLRTRAFDPVPADDMPPRRRWLRGLFPRSQDTHQRWLDARLIAESQRSGQLLAWIGFAGRRPLDPAAVEDDDHHHGHHLAAGGHAAPRTVWAPHYANAIAALPDLPLDEAAGTPLAAITPPRVAALAEAAGQVIGDQKTYHDLNHQRLEALNHRLDTFSLRAIQIAAAFSAAYLLLWAVNLETPAWAPWPALLPDHSPVYKLGKVLSYLAAFSGGVLPAVAAAAAGIRFQGDFERFALRSKDTAARLDVLAERAARIAKRARGCGEEACKGQPPLVEPLLDLLLDTQAVLDEDLADWRFAYAARPITLG